MYAQRRINHLGCLQKHTSKNELGNADFVGMHDATDNHVAREIWFMVWRGSDSFVPIFVFHRNCYHTSYARMRFFTMCPRFVLCSFTAALCVMV